MLSTIRFIARLAETETEAETEREVLSSILEVLTWLTEGISSRSMYVKERFARWFSGLARSSEGIPSSR